MTPHWSSPRTRLNRSVHGNVNSWGGGYNLSSWAEKDAYEHADRVIAVSAGMREDILTAYPNLDPDKVVVVHTGHHHEPV